MVYLFFVAAVAVLLLVLAADHVKNRFEHTPRSRRILEFEAVAALIVGALLVSYVFHPGSVAWTVFIGILVAVPVFVMAAYATVELWRRQKQRKFDEQVHMLSRSASGLREEVQRLNWRERDLSQRRGRVEDRKRGRLEHQADVRRQLAHWERGGGLTRLRTIKVRDWQEEFEALSTEKLQRRQEELRATRSQVRGEDADQLQAQLMVLELTLLGRELGGATPPEIQVDSQLSELRSDRRELEHELSIVEQELEEWRRRRQQFLGDKIKLD